MNLSSNFVFFPLNNETTIYNNNELIDDLFIYLNKLTVIVLYTQMLFGLTLNFISITCILFAFVRFKAFTSINILIVNLGWYK
jgi:hypothetical protein